MAKICSGKLLILSTWLVVMSGLLIPSAFADNSHGKKRRERSHKLEHSPLSQMPSAYKELCGSCHMAYGAYMLPEESWVKILGAQDGHFGTELDLDDSERKQVSDYLFVNAADRNGGKIGRKIMKNSQNAAPERISTLPYIQHKHRKIDPAVFARPSVGGLQNCVSCHPRAEQGDFDEHGVKIPLTSGYQGAEARTHAVDTHGEKKAVGDLKGG